MNRSSVWVVGIALVLVAGCTSNGEDERDAAAESDLISSNDAAVGDARHDQAVSDSRVDSVAADTAPVVPDPPSLSQPSADHPVHGRVEISGQAEPGAAIVVKVLKGATELGSARGVAAPSGAIELAVTYLGAVHQDELTVSVTQTTAGGTSAPATVVVSHQVPLTLSGVVWQTSGNTDGTKVFVRLYDANFPEVIDHIDQLELTATEGQLLDSTNYSFAVADGAYFLRAFRDANGPRESGPDGEPSLQSDPQASAVWLAMDGADQTKALEIKQRTNSDDSFEGFDVRAVNESSVAEPPSYREGDERKRGPGLCRGYFLSLQLHGRGNPDNLSKPRVRFATGEVKELLDDGGCGEEVHDNSAMSYDYDPNDGHYRYGIADPSAAHAGDYVLFYTQNTDEFFHIERDTVAEVRKLPLLRDGVKPDGAQVNGDRTPTISWNPVPGAAAYEVSLRQQGEGDLLDHYVELTVPSFTSPQLPDDACFDLHVRALDADRQAGEDIDAEAHGSRARFCIDEGGDSSVYVEGAINNNSGERGPYGILAFGDDERHNSSTLRLGPEANAYGIWVLKSDSDDSGTVSAFLDVAGTGDDDAPANRALRVDRSRLDFSAAASGVDLTFNPEMLLSAPVEGATASSLQPTFSWQDYAVTAGSGAPSGSFGYAVFFSQGSEGGFPSSILAVPSTVLAFDLSSPPADYFDVIPLVHCIMGGGTFSIEASANPRVPTCTGGPSGALDMSAMTLAPASTYAWGVVVVDCNYADYQSSEQSEMDRFLACVEALVADQTNYAMSLERVLRTPSP